MNAARVDAARNGDDPAVVLLNVDPSNLILDADILVTPPEASPRARREFHPPQPRLRASRGNFKTRRRRPSADLEICIHCDQSHRQAPMRYVM